MAIAVAQILATTVAATAVGARLPGFALPSWHGAARWATHTAAGLFAVAAVVYGLVGVHAAGRANLQWLLALLVLIAVMSTAMTAWRRVKHQAAAPPVSGRPGAVEWIAGALAVAYTAWIVACAALPPTAVDELNHHLAVPKALLATGGSVEFRDNIYASFPPLGEMLFLFGLGVGGEAAARLFHVVYGIVLAAAVFGISRRYLSRGDALWPVALVLSVPTVMVILPWAYVDVIFSAYAFLALTLLLEFLATGELRWAALAGMMAGGALATKYTGIQLTMLLALLVLIDHAWARRRAVPVAVLVLVMPVLIVAAPILWRNWQLTGWPLFPFPVGSLPIREGINWDVDRAFLFLSLLASYGSSASPAPAGFLDAVLAPFLVFVTATFNDPRLYDGMVGAVFLLIPLVLRGRLDRPAVWLAVFAAVYLFYWGATVRQVRFLVPLVPVLAILLALGLAGRSRLLKALVAAALLVSLVNGVSRVLAADPWAFWTGQESRDAYLTRHLPVYDAYQSVNRRLQATDRVLLLHMRNLGYYLEVDWTGDFVFESYEVERALRADDPDGALRDLFARRGLTHLLIDERVMFAQGVLTNDQQEVLRAVLERATRLDLVDGRALYQLDHVGGGAALPRAVP